MPGLLMVTDGQKGTCTSPGCSDDVSEALRRATKQVSLGHRFGNSGRHTAAVEAYGQAVTVLRSTPPGTRMADGRPVEMELIATLTDLSVQLSKLGRHTQALDRLDEVRAFTPRSEADRAHFAMTFRFAEARVLRCANRLELAADRYIEGLNLAQQLGQSRTGLGTAQLAATMNSLVEVLHWDGRAADAHAVAGQAAALAGWPRMLQRPVHHYSPGLTTTGWLEPARFPEVAAAVRSLVDAFPALRREYLALLALDGAFARQTECLHDPDRGAWSYHTVLGDTSRACADTAPAACGWLDAAERAIPSLHVRRIGYSVVEPQAWIRPHTGVDNTLLKLHLGLVVPDGSCAALTIDAETRAWHETEVLFFDDSFEHEVWNRCSTPRAVLQLVIAHPMM